MSNYLRLLIVPFAFLFCIAASAQKKVVAGYSGGHGCIDKELLLYNDSTYKFTVWSGLFIPMKSKKRGLYLIEEDNIYLFSRKRFHYFFFQEKNKYSKRPYEYRIRNKAILMYSENDEESKDSSFIKAYNTMWLMRSSG